MINIIPAIDIKEGKCVRLIKGEYDTAKIYYDDPLIPAIKWKKAGAKRLHIVDLDGAREGKLRNIEIVEKIKRATEIDIELGGGIRDIETVKKIIDVGIDYAIIGTAATENYNFLRELEKFKKYILISVDIKGEQLQTRGWLQNSDISWRDYLKVLLDYSFNKIIVTDINRDGTLTGINRNLYKMIYESFPTIDVIISGGISSIEDIKKIKNSKIGNVSGVIIGKALYEDKINLKEAIKYVSEENNSLS